MKLLFDQNLSFRLCRQLADIFPESTQVRLVGLDRADDRTRRDFAKANGPSFASVRVTASPITILQSKWIDHFEKWELIEIGIAGADAPRA
jgi:hypothetical protein